MSLPEFDRATLIHASEVFFLSYFFLLNAFYILLNLVSMISLKRYMLNKPLEGLPQLQSGFEIPVSILVPAYNEETTIVASIKSMLQLSYPSFEIVVVNDGSKDSTLDVLKSAFSLVPFPEAYRTRLATQPVICIYQSTTYHGLRVIDKKNGGKADSLNAAINASRFPLICAVDADTLLQRDSLRQLVRTFAEDRRVVAAGGMIRVANGCEVSGGFLTKVSLPNNILALFQTVEYIRAFLFGRQGWSALGALLIISGAFGLFRKETVIEVGGFLPNTIGEDMELVVRMHRILRQRKKVYRMAFLADSVAWTEAPEDFKTLKNQRVRWQRGLSESLSGNLGLMFSRNGGTPGWLAFPFMLLFEWLGPLLEFCGYALMVLLLSVGMISAEAFRHFVLAAIGFGLLLSVSGLFLEEMYFHIYSRPKHLAWLMFAVVMENFGYRQLNFVWRVIGLFKWISGSQSKWGDMKRKSTWESPTT